MWSMEASALAAFEVQGVARLEVEGRVGVGQKQLRRLSRPLWAAEPFPG